MKKLFYSLLAITFICFSGSTHAMKRKNTTLTIRNPQNTKQIQEPLWLPEETIAHIAGYCEPKEKNILMRLSHAFYTSLKNRTAILKANPFTVSMSDKIEDTIEYARLGNTEMIELLLNSGVKANYKNILGVSPFHAASDNKQTKAMQLLVAQGADVNELKETHALHEAAYTGDKKTIQELLSLKINPNLPLKNGNTALFIASTKGRTEVVKLLIDAGAVNHANNNGSNALLIASSKGHTDIVKLLIAAGANVDHVNNIGASTLLIASQNGHADIVKLLLTAGANVNTVTNSGWSALLIASEKSHTDIVKLLLDARANVNHVVKNEVSALIITSQNGHTNVAKLLIAAGANVNYTNNIGVSALLFASQNGYTDIVKLLLATGTNINHANNNGSIALFMASKNSHTDIVKLLLAAGADVNYANNHGVSALGVASYNGYTDIVKLLLAAGANMRQARATDSIIDLIIKKGDTPLQIAQKKDHTHIVELFEWQLQREETMKRLQNKEEIVYIDQDFQQDLKAFIDTLPNARNKK